MGGGRTESDVKTPPKGKSRLPCESLLCYVCYAVRHRSEGAWGSRGDTAPWTRSPGAQGGVVKRSQDAKFAPYCRCSEVEAVGSPPGRRSGCLHFIFWGRAKHQMKARTTKRLTQSRPIRQADDDNHDAKYPCFLVQRAPNSRSPFQVQVIPPTNPPVRTAKGAIAALVMVAFASSWQIRGRDARPYLASYINAMWRIV